MLTPRCSALPHDFQLRHVAVLGCAGYASRDLRLWRADTRQWLDLSSGGGSAMHWLEEHATARASLLRALTQVSARMRSPPHTQCSFDAVERERWLRATPR